MALRFSVHHGLAAVVGLALMAPGTVLARDPGQGGWRDGRWQDSPSGHAPRIDARQNYYSPAQEAWLADCRSRISARDSGVGGAVIGGVVGGVAGNRIAGRGNRTVGTLAGAAVGAAAGALIDRAEDSGRNRDECEAYLDDYYTRYEGGQYSYPSGPYHGSGHSYAQPGYPAGYAGYYPAPHPYGCCASVPVMMVPTPVQSPPECTETVEYVYEDVPVKRRAYRPAKRTKVVPDKRVKITSGK